MFEKAAEEYVEHWIVDEDDNALMQEAFKDGAEFGYNKAKEDADKMKSRFLELCNLKDMRIEELEKANEWNYVKDGKYPTHENKVLCILGDIENKNCEVGYYSQVASDEKRWRFNDYDLSDDSEEYWGVSAWKNITWPEVK